MHLPKTTLTVYEKILRRVNHLYAYLFGYSFFKPLNSFLVSIGHRGLGVNNNLDYLEGIKILIKKLAKKIDDKNNLFLDIGAHQGTITKIVLDNTQNLNVICYEPHSEHYKKLSQSLNKEKRCKIFQYAVGSKIENKILFDWKKHGTGFASFYKDSIKQFLLPTYGKISLDYENSVKVITLDSINYDKKIEFIKIDVEGNEFEVLKGARDSIKNHEPKYILLEFGEPNVYSRVFLKDLINLLDNYSSYRVMPGGKMLELNNPYNVVTHEFFCAQNIIFVKNNKEKKQIS